MKEGLAIGEMVNRIRTHALDQPIVALSVQNAGKLRERVRARISLDQVGKKQPIKLRLEVARGGRFWSLTSRPNTEEFLRKF
jgi:hypothetical protein